MSPPVSPSAPPLPARLSDVRTPAVSQDHATGSLHPLAAVAARVLHAPIALVTLVGGRRETVEGSTGLPESWARRRVLPAALSFGTHMVASGEPFLVEDTRKHDLTRDNPAVREFGALAYAGVPIRVEQDVVGTLGVIDHLPRRWFDEEIEILVGLAGVAEFAVRQHLALRRERRAREESSRSFAEQLDSVSLFRTLVEQSLAGIYVIRNGRIGYANPRVRQIFGYPVDVPLHGLRVADLVAEEDRARVEENIRRRVEGEEESLHYTFRGLRRDGSVVEVEVLGSAIEIDGEPAVVGTVLDLTERRQVEAALQEHAQRLRLVERATNDVIWEWEVQSGRVRWNDAGPGRFRYAPDEVGDSIEWHQERIHPEDRERVVRRLQQALSSATEYWTDEYRFLRGDGQYAVVLDRGCVVRSERGDPVRVLGILMDVTERRREEEAQRFLSKANALLDSSLDHESVLARLARASVPLLGDYCVVDLVEEDGVLRRVATAHVDPIKEILLGAEQEGADDTALRRVMETGSAVLTSDCDEKHLQALGFGDAERDAMRRVGVCSLIVAPLLTGDHRTGTITVGVSESNRQFNPLDLMLVRDLAGRIGLAVDHARLYHTATRAVRARDEIFGVLSHDLRNPLSSIQMTTALLRETVEDRRPETEKWLALIQRTVDEMKVLIDDLLDVSTIDAGRFSVAPTDRTPAALLRDAAELLQPLTLQKRIELRTHADEDLPSLRVDSHQILRVLSNLVGNAVKFTPARGTVTLRADRQRREVRFSVADTGPGISPEHLPHLFDRFWQARQGDRRGAGLGLSIARGIVEAHGGRIWAESTPGEGAIFVFTIPVPSPAPAAEAVA